MLNFIKGAKLDTYYSFTDDCVYSGVNTVDDWFYYQKLSRFE